MHDNWTETSFLPDSHHNRSTNEAAEVFEERKPVSFTSLT